MASEQQTEILIVGGGIGGCAAALSAARAGRRVVMTEETDWIGGQLTSQAVPPDEHGWIENFGCTASYRRFRNDIRKSYRDNYRLSELGKKQKHFNPGDGWVSPLCHEPRIALDVLEKSLTPYVDSGQLQILLEHFPVTAELAPDDRITAVTVRCLTTGEDRTISAKYILDATELGELLPLSKAEFRIGSESQLQTGEQAAATEANNDNIQAMSYCFAVDYLDGEDHTIEQPDRYSFWRDYTPRLTPPWPGKLFDWTGCNPRTLQPVKYSFSPHQESPKAFSGLWSYRRIVARSQFEPGTFASDICTINWPMIDYLEGHLFNESREENNRQLEAAKQMSLSFLYWLQTEAPRPNGNVGFPELRLRNDVVGTGDGLAKFPYIRESRRIEAEFTVCQQHICPETESDDKRATRFEDSVGIGSYRIDLHPTTAGDNYLDLPVAPFQIPLGSLIPIRLNNLIPAAKNLGVTHITGGCYRLHPIEWNIGEVAGLLACFCLEKVESPRGIYSSTKRLREFQSVLVKQGIELEWPEKINLKEGDPHAHAM